jgi:hypothetical protein
MHHPFELTIADLESIDLEPVDGATVELIVGGALDFLRSSSTNPLLNSMRQKTIPSLTIASSRPTRDASIFKREDTSSLTNCVTCAEQGGETGEKESRFNS